MRSIISTVSISPEGFLPSIFLLLVVIIVTVVIVVVTVILVVVVVAIIGVVIVVTIIGVIVVVVSSIIKLSFVIIGFEVVAFPSILLGNPPIKASISFSAFGILLGQGILGESTSSKFQFVVLGTVATRKYRFSSFKPTYETNSSFHTIEVERLATHKLLSGGGVVDLTSDEDLTDEDGDIRMGDSASVLVSLGVKIFTGGKKCRESNIGDSDNTEDGGKIVGGAIVILVRNKCPRGKEPTEGYEDAVVVPVITADNFELKHGLLTLVQNKQFFGHDKEDPYAHVHYFNKITSTLKFPNVPNTSIKLMLFSFSLESAARIWLEKESPQLIFTWDDLVSKFINQFFPPSKTTNLQLHQPDTIYNALNSKDQDSLNSAAGGNFLDKMPSECLGIIESKSKVRYSCNKPVVAKVSTTTSTSGVSPDVTELKDMVRALLLDKKGQNQSPAPVKAIEESCVTCGGAHSYRNCPAIDGNNYRDNI
nr:reverse transcriptase domain-containing protein [Tanacetum cinerariifolium]